MSLFIYNWQILLIHGGTLELVQIFNHIGAVASLETHEDLLKAVAKARKEHAVHRELTPNAFQLQVVTRDNLDIIYTKPRSGVYISVLQDKAGTEHLVSVLNPYQFQVSLKQPNPPLRLWLQEHFHLSYWTLLTWKSILTMKVKRRSHFELRGGRTDSLQWPLQRTVGEWGGRHHDGCVMELGGFKHSLVMALTKATDLHFLLSLTF